MATLEPFRLTRGVLPETRIPPQAITSTFVRGAAGQATPAGRSVPPPDGSLLLGFDAGGNPLLFDPYDPAQSPLLVVGDGGSGKTALIKSLARASDQPSPGDIQFGVVTPFPEEWTDLEMLPGCLGVWPGYHPATREFLVRLIKAAEGLREGRQLILLLVDGLDLLTACSFKIQQELGWLLRRGPGAHISPVVTINPARLPRLDAWLECFPRRLFGQVRHLQANRVLADDRQLDLAGLVAGDQFCLSFREGGLKFRLPSAG